MAWLLGNLLVLALGCFPGQARGEGLDFLSPKQEDLSFALNATLRAMRDENNAPETDRRQFAAIESSIAEKFQALPKTPSGRLLPPAVRHVVNYYFAHEHGMFIEGLHGLNTHSKANVHNAAILSERAPALVEKMLEGMRNGRGLSFEDVVAMVATLERLIFDEAITTLEALYDLNGIDVSMRVNATQADWLLTSYLVVLRYGLSRVMDPVYYKAFMDGVQRLESWPRYKEFVNEGLADFLYSRQHQLSPFGGQIFSFKYLALMARKLATQFGRWQDQDCTIIKDALMKLDVVGSGRVPIEQFYGTPKTSQYKFHESIDYLRTISALQVTPSGQKLVRIANYVQSPSNCIGHSEFYTICCRSECNELMSVLEGDLQAPVAHPNDILRLVSDLASSTIDAPRVLPEALVSKLEQIGAHHAGSIPLHGRLFSQWMHYAFPNECPYPLAENADFTFHSSSVKYAASKKEIARHLKNATSVEEGYYDEPVSDWSDLEILPLEESKFGKQLFKRLSAPVGIIAKLALLIVGLRAAFTSLQGAVRAFKGFNADVCKAASTFV